MASKPGFRRDGATKPPSKGGAFFHSGRKRRYGRPFSPCSAGARFVTLSHDHETPGEARPSLLGRGHHTRTPSEGREGRQLPFSPDDQSRDRQAGRCEPRCPLDRAGRARPGSDGRRRRGSEPHDRVSPRPSPSSPERRRAWRRRMQHPDSRGGFRAPCEPVGSGGRVPPSHPSGHRLAALFAAVTGNPGAVPSPGTHRLALGMDAINAGPCRPRGPHDWHPQAASSGHSRARLDRWKEAIVAQRSPRLRRAQSPCRLRRISRRGDSLRRGSHRFPLT
jgi:hypothetical protein